MTEKSAAVGHTIGPLGRLTGVNIETIRYYERIGLVPKPSRTAGGYRLYGSAHIGRLTFIRNARELGFPIDTIRALLGLADDRNRPCGDVDRIASAHLTEVEGKIARLTTFKKELERMISQCRHGTVSECRIIEALANRSVPDTDARVR